MVVKDTGSVRVNLRLPDDLMAGTLRSKVETSDPGEQ
jgi:hypothetical protein